MKTNKIRYGIFGLFLLLFAGCAPENELITDAVPVTEGETVTVRFSATIPDYHTVQTRANGGVNDMYLLVFNESGSFIKRVLATLTSQTDAGGTFTAELPASIHQRTIHFICNYDWTGFSDNAMLYKNEAAIVAIMSTQNATFWAREVLPSGINANSFDSPKVVDILRNQAKISVASNASGFTYQSFAIHNAPNKGTVAPFNTGTAQFTVGTITEPAGVLLTTPTTSDFSTAEKFLFERKNATASDITTVIVKGTYSGNDYYYKIDLIDADKNRYNIERNWHYAVTINSVSSAGYANLSDALAGAAHNNTVLDPIIEKYPMISDGTSKLEVEKTLVILTQPGETFNVWYKYFPDMNSTTVINTGVTVTIESGNEAINTWSFNNATGTITASAVTGTITEQKEARFIVTKGDLARSIRVILRTPFSFEPITINNTNPGIVTNGQSQDATLKFTIPDEFPDDLFPLTIKIYTQGLYAASTGLELEVENGQIYYIYRATATGEQTVNFKTNKSGNSETVTLKADYFTDGTVRYGFASSISGTIKHGAANASAPVGTDVPVGANVTASTGSITITSAGKYTYNSPDTYTSNTPVTLTWVKQVNANRVETYTYTTTIGGLLNNTSIAMNLISTAISGTITHGGANASVPAGTNIPAGAAITSSTGSLTITSAGYYTYTTTSLTGSVTFTYQKQVSGNYKEEYAYTTTISNLISNPSIAMTPFFVFEGKIEYYENYRSWGSWSQRWSNLNANANVSVTGVSNPTMTVPSNGNYKLIIPSVAGNSSITFSYSYTVNYGLFGSSQTFTVTQTKTIDQLKADSGLRLN